MSRPEKVQAALRLMGNPYASLSLFLEDEEVVGIEPSFEQKRAYLKKLENPHAFNSIFEDSDDNLWQAAAKRQKNNMPEVLEKELDNILLQYKPFVARNQWDEVMNFKTSFLKQASETTQRAEQVINRLQKLRFSLAPGEKVEYNRAPANRIIDELKKILG